VFTVLAALSGMEREYIRGRTLEGHESARARGRAIGGAAVTGAPCSPPPCTCAARN
jgi:DNA invertase Pin-like site-specific DNA recombinase